MRYPAYLEVGPNGHTLAYVFALPGLFVQAPKPDAALAALPLAIASELESPDGIEINEAERVDVRSDVEHGVSSALFRYELRPTTDDDVARTLARIALDPVPSEDDRLRALADGEWWLLSRLGTRAHVALPYENALDRFQAVRAATIERFGALLPGDRERHAVFAGE